MLKDVNKFIEKIKSMEEKIYLSLFKEFFELSSQARYAKELINAKNWDESKERVEEIEYTISDSQDEIKKMSEKEKKDKNADEKLEVIKKILDLNKDVQNFFHRSSKVDEGKSEPKTGESIAERMKLRRQKLNIIAKKRKYKQWIV